MREKCAKSAPIINLSAQEQIIVEYIAENGMTTSEQVMTLLNVRKRRAQTVLGKLVEDGVICKEGASRSTYYILNEELPKK